MQFEREMDSRSGAVLILSSNRGLEGYNTGMAEAAIADQLEEGAYATPLHFAVKENDVKKVRELLQEGGVKVTTRDIIGRTPLHWALVFGHDEAAKVLIVNTPRRALDARDERGCTPLHYAAARGHADVARVLVERGAAINGLDAKKRTPLHYAAQQVGPELVELLVSRGADKSLADVAGELPVSVAEKWGSSQSIACLRPDTITTTSEKVVANKDKEVGSCARPSPVVERPATKGPSLERLLGAWKAAEEDARRKKEAEVEAAHKATATLQEALRAWRDEEQAVRSVRFKVGEASCSSSSSGGSPHGSEYEVEGMLMPSQSQCQVLVRLDGASTSGSSSASGSWPLLVEVVSSIDGEEDSADSKPLRDLSWCTEWEAQEDAAETSQCLSPRERKPVETLESKEEESPLWVQVPMFKQKFERNFDKVSLSRTNSFDRLHLIAEVEGIMTKLPFMSSLEVY